MKKLLISGLILASTITQADTIRDRIHAIEDGMIKFENGRIAFMQSSDDRLVPDAEIEAQVDDESKLLSFKTVSTPMIDRRLMSALENTPTAPVPFEPSIVPNMTEMQNIFDRSNSYYKRVSECTDRAHVWAHDEFKFSGTKSKKVFVFFTASYIDSVGLKWWFHVAPLYSVNTGSGVQEMVADFRYSSRPMTVKEWTDLFVFTKRTCKVTTKFSEYDVNPQTENCYLMYESMHYKIPAELSAQESGRYKSNTPESEVNFSRKLGFQPNPGL